MQELMTALITPFQKDGEVDYPALKALVRQQLNEGCDGFIVCGTTAETPTLTHAERMKILKLVLAETNGKAQVWYGCGSNHTEAAIAACKEASTYAISGVLLVTPYYNRPSQEGIYQHFKKINDNCDVDIMLYNIPSRTGSTLQVETLKRLINDCTHIRALKHASDDLQLVKDIVQQYPNFRIYSGEDGLFEEGFEAGMCGLISVMSHVAMKPLKAFLQNQKDEKKRAFLKECATMTFLDASPAPVKYMMSKQGRCANVLRLPMVPVTQDKQEILDQWMAENDI